MPKGRKMLLSDFNGPKAKDNFLPTGPSGLGGNRRFDGPRGPGGRGGRYGDQYGDRKDRGEADDSRADGSNNWRGGGGYGGYGGGGGGFRREGGFGGREGDEGDLGRSDGARDWRSNKRSGGFGGGSRYGDRDGPPSGGLRDRYGGGGGGGGGFRDKYGGDRYGDRPGYGGDRGGFGGDRGGFGGGGGGWGSRSGGGDGRPAHLRRFAGLRKDGPSERSASSNAFGALGSNQGDRRGNMLDRPPLRQMGIAGRVQTREEREAARRTKSRESKPSARKKDNKKSPTDAPPGTFKKKSGLEKALDEEKAVSNKMLKSGLKKLDLNDDTQGEKLAVCLAKSLKEEKLSLDQVDAALLKEAQSEGVASRLLAITFAKLKIENGGEEKGEESVTKFIADSKFNALEALRRKKTNAQMTEFLKKYGLEFLKGGPDLASVIQAALDEGQKPEEIVAAIDAIAGEGDDVSICTRAVADHVANKVFSKDSKQPQLVVLKTFVPLLKRCTKDNLTASVQVLFALQGAWFKVMKSNRDFALDVFKRVHDLKICSHEEFEAWRADRKDKTKGKPQCLLAVFSFLSELKAKNKPVEPDYDEDQDEDEGEDQDEFNAAPTFVK